MNIIDAHIHTNFSSKDMSAFAQMQKIDFSWEGLQHSLNSNKVVAAIAITYPPSAVTPGESELLLSQAEKDPRIKPVCAINPNFVGEKYLKAVEKLLQAKKLYGLKIFAGYHPVFPDNEKYFPFYKLAGEYDVPVIIHTGDTFGSDYLVKYAHPLPVDDIAVKFRNVRFVIAHLGNPWVRDAVELVYKNENVFADFSAFCIGHKNEPPEHIRDDVKYALDASERPGKFMYGSDWPLADMEDYIMLIKAAVPKKYHQKVFFENAKRVFKL